MDADARARIAELARAEGFSLVRVASANSLDEARDASLDRQSRGLLAGMRWMTPEWLQRSTDPERFLEGAQSVILLALPYTPTSSPSPVQRERGPGGEGAGARNGPHQANLDATYATNRQSPIANRESVGPGGEGPPANRQSPIVNRQSTGRIARYAQGRDYHRVFEKKLRRIARTIREEFGAEARATVDYGPLLERPLAARAGMGWLGKSTMLLVPGFGPWVLLGAIATTLELDPDLPLRKTCGACTRCIVACPTGAISPAGHVLDARLCISYHTIENRGPIPRELRPKFGDWIFGCDDCLSSCPVGINHTEGYREFDPPDEHDAAPALAPLLELTEEDFVERYRGRPIMRAKRDGFLRNVCIALGNVGTPEDLPALLDALKDPAPLVRGHAAWAIARLAGRHRIEAPFEALQYQLDIEPDTEVQEELRHALKTLRR